MTNIKHLDILKQGVNNWNRWREKHHDIRPDLSRADLTGLNGGNFSNTNLSNTNMSGTYFSEIDLGRANLSGADLSRAYIVNVDLSYANLSDASLSATYFSGTDFSYAHLHRAELTLANLNHVVLDYANLTEATIGWTTFADVNLQTAKGLESIVHEAPSTIGFDTIIRSKGKISEIFLRNAGIPDSIIEAIPSLVGSLNPIDFYSCFISCSRKDQGFAERLYTDLQSKGIRCWYAPHHMKTGDKIRDRIDESIRIYDKLLLVLSEHSITSSWVEHEVEAALDKERLARERHMLQTVLFPITLDDAIMSMESSWPAKVRRERHITDFRHWKQRKSYQQAFENLLRDLKAGT